MVVFDDYCDGILLGNVNFCGDLEFFEEVVYGLCVFGYERCISGGFYELVVILDRYNEDFVCKLVVLQFVLDFKYGIEEQSKFFFLLYLVQGKILF